MYKECCFLFWVATSCCLSAESHSCLLCILLIYNVNWYCNIYIMVFVCISVKFVSAVREQKVSHFC